MKSRKFAKHSCVYHGFTIALYLIYQVFEVSSEGNVTVTINTNSTNSSWSASINYTSSVSVVQLTHSIFNHTSTVGTVASQSIQAPGNYCQIVTKCSCQETASSPSSNYSMSPLVQNMSRSINVSYASSTIANASLSSGMNGSSANYSMTSTLSPSPSSAVLNISQNATLSITPSATQVSCSQSCWNETWCSGMNYSYGSIGRTYSQTSGNSTIMTEVILHADCVLPLQEYSEMTVAQFSTSSSTNLSTLDGTYSSHNATMIVAQPLSSASVAHLSTSNGITTTYNATMTIAQLSSASVAHLSTSNGITSTYNATMTVAQLSSASVAHLSTSNGITSTYNATMIVAQLLSSASVAHLSTSNGITTTYNATMTIAQLSSASVAHLSTSNGITSTYNATMTVAQLSSASVAHLSTSNGITSTYNATMIVAQLLSSASVAHLSTSNGITTTYNATMTIAQLSSASVAHLSTSNGITSTYNATMTVAQLSSASVAHLSTSNGITSTYNATMTSVTQLLSSSPVAHLNTSNGITTTSFSISPTPSSSILVASSASPTIPPVCVKDCADTCNGAAVYNPCKICVGGTTNRTMNAGKDCSNVCNGTARNDSCGACTTVDQTKPAGWSSFKDCNGTCYGSATTDTCGNCTGGNTGQQANFARDACGVCYGDNSSCVGCDGIPKSGNTDDACGVCGGDGSTCIDLMRLRCTAVPSGSPTVTFYGAGLTLGSKAICKLLNPTTGSMVTNATADDLSLTKGTCTLPPWTDWTPGYYNLTLTVEYSDGTAITTNKSLSFYYYNSSATVASGITPSELLTTDLPASVYLLGGSFFPGRGQYCMFGDIKTPAEYINSTTLKCSVPALSQSQKLAVSFTVDGGCNNISTGLNLTISVPAPNITSAKLSDTGAQIEVQFSGQVATESLTSCSAIFDSATVGKFGANPKCSWLSRTRIRIILGIGATTVVGDVLDLKNNMIKAHNQRYSKYSSGSVVLQSPNNPVKPTPVITGPQTLSSCGNVSLSGSQSLGGGGRPLHYNWTLVIPETGSDVGPIKDVLRAQSSDSFTMNGNKFTSDKLYQIKLCVNNFIDRNRKYCVTHNVTKSADPVPSLTVNAPIDKRTGTVSVSDSFFITAKAVVAPCVNNSKVDFSWSVTCSNSIPKQRLEANELFRRTKKQSALKIDKRVLVGGERCTFTVTGRMNSNSAISSTASIIINPIGSPLRAVIAGGNREMGRGCGEFHLDALTFTVDPDATTSPLSCQWSCKTSEGRACYSNTKLGQVINIPNECKPTVNCREFKVETYTISVIVSKQSRTATASMSLNVVEEDIPLVWLDVPDVPVLAKDTFRLKGYYNTSKQPSLVKWVAKPKTGFSSVDPNSADLRFGSPVTTFKAGKKSLAFISLKPNALAPGASYSFELQVTVDQMMGKSSMDVVVRQGPTSGTFTSSSLQAVGLSEITLLANSWVTDDDAMPLMYTFGYFNATGSRVVWGKSNLNTRKQLISSGHLFLRVTDKFGSVAERFLNITVTPADVDSTAINNLIRNKVDALRASGDSLGAVAALSSISNTLNSAPNASKELKANVSRTTQDFINGIVTDMPLDSDIAGTLLSTLVITESPSADRAESVLNTNQLLVLSLNSPMSNEMTKNIMRYLGGISKDGQQSDAVVEKIIATYDSIASNHAKGMSPGDPHKVIVNEDVSVTVQPSLLDSTTKTSNAADAPSISFPASMMSQYSSWPCALNTKCAGVAMKLTEFKKIKPVASNTETQEVLLNKATDITLVNPQTGEDIIVNNLQDPIVLTFVVEPAQPGKTYICLYNDAINKIWSSSGLTAEYSGHDGCICKSTHTTTFVPANSSLATTTYTTPTYTPTTATTGEIDKYYVLFALTNTTWNANLSDTNSLEYGALASDITREIGSVYASHPSYRGVSGITFKHVNGRIVVSLTLTFGPSSTSPVQTLKDAFANGKLGSLSVDPDSLVMTKIDDKQKPSESDNTAAIIGGTVGGAILLMLIIGVIIYCIKKNSNKVEAMPHP